MSSKICPNCMGYKRVNGHGGMRIDCPDCNSTGWVIFIDPIKEDSDKVSTPDFKAISNNYYKKVRKAKK